MAAFKRNVFLRINKFQWRIIFYLCALGFSSLILMMLFLAYLHADTNNFLHRFEFLTIKFCIITALPITAFLILIVCIYTYYMTNKIFGPYERVLHELKTNLENGEKKSIVLRDGDDMFQELIDQINILIEQKS